ncbi:MAG: hypothetical protein OES46_16775 [Gammaproteobacteria bacterium]|jgi:hypothetical protein|nr:hypothetical protein [Gammaproteobacteria bacterium]
MPYFIYRISPARKLDLVDSFDSYRDAKRAATALRIAQEPDDACTVKIVFAKDSAEAEQLLRTERERPPSEDD